MMELSPSQIGGLGVAAMLVLCFVGVRFAFAAAFVGTTGLTMMIGWDAGLRTARIVPYAAGANYTLSVLPMFILIGYLAFRQITSALGLTSIAGHAQSIRPMVAPMAEGAVEARTGPLSAT